MDSSGRKNDDAAEIMLTWVWIISRRGAFGGGRTGKMLSAKRIISGNAARLSAAGRAVGGGRWSHDYVFQGT